MTFLSGTSACSLERLQIHILFQELLQRRCTIQCKKQILNNYNNSCVQNAMAKNQNLPVSKVIFLWSTYSLHQLRPQNVCSCLWNPCWYLIAATKKVKWSSPAVHSLKEDDSFFSQSYRMLSIWLCPNLFWNDKCHFSSLKWCLKFFQLQAQK